MARIMQGTTPSVMITINPDDFLLSNVTKMELYVRNGSSLKTYTADDLDIDTIANTITKTFTEAETAALDSKKNVVIQGRFWLGNAVVGIKKISYGVDDMMGVGRDG